MGLFQMSPEGGHGEISLPLLGTVRQAIETSEGFRMNWIRRSYKRSKKTEISNIHVCKLSESMRRHVARHDQGVRLRKVYPHLWILGQCSGGMSSQHASHSVER